MHERRTSKRHTSILGEANIRVVTTQSRLISTCDSQKTTLRDRLYSSIEERRGRTIRIEVDNVKRTTLVFLKVHHHRGVTLRGSDNRGVESVFFHVTADRFHSGIIEVIHDDLRYVTFLLGDLLGVSNRTKTCRCVVCRGRRKCEDYEEKRRKGTQR